MPNDEMGGKICLVTGASRGIGFFTAAKLAAKGAHVVLVGHNQERGQAAVDRIRESTSKGSADFMLADLSILDQVRGLTTRFQEQYSRLDVLVNNVGGFFLQHRESADGIEMTFALNHLSCFLVTNLLIDALEASTPARVVTVASEAHRGARVHFDDLEFEQGYNGAQAYGQSKLANLLFTYELARRLEGTEVTSNALHPGFVDTHLGEQHWLLRPLLKVLHLLFAKTPEEGAETSVYLASSPEVEGASGEYFIDKEPTPSSPPSYDESAAKRLWEISAETVRAHGLVSTFAL